MEEIMKKEEIIKLQNDIEKELNDVNNLKKFME